ncbi:MAG: RluA family pseudouridine synthase [Candidatus Saccharimonadales bacterium]|nr:RluA family pseudouridine synthase [Candidatus Saccharimonadales bacterium]
MTKELIVDAKQRNERADVVLASEIDGYSRSQVKRLFDDNRVIQAGKILKPADKVSGLIEVSLFESKKEPQPIKVLYEDNDVVVIDKPSGLLTHAKGGHIDEFTIADFIAAKTTDQSAGRPGIVHRLDRATSGVMILAKNTKSRVMLQKQFSSRTAKKQYIALVKGLVKPAKQRFEWPIARNPKKPSTFKVSPQGKAAVTDIELLDTVNSQSKLLVVPETGRTHQIRVHLAHAGHPVVGDSIYGGPKAPRLMLHAALLKLTTPDGTNREFRSTEPQDFL